MKALFLSSDLMFASKVAAAATRQQVQVDTALSLAALEAKAQAADVALVMIDLETSRLDLPALVESLRHAQPAATILAFGPHVHTEALAAAHEAGCDIVISRGQFNAQLDELLKHYLAGGHPAG